MIISLLLIFTGLTGMFIQDIKYRHIHILLPLITFFSAVYSIGQKYNAWLFLKIILSNIMFIIATVFIMAVYMSLKNRVILNPFKNYFGLGDLLFYIAISPFFILYNYILFFIFSLVFVLVAHYIFKKYMVNKTIPLAGYASVLVLFILAGDIFINSSQNITLLSTN